MTLNKRIISLAVLLAFLVASIAIGSFAWFTKNFGLGGADIGTGELGLTCGSYIYTTNGLELIKENPKSENTDETPEGTTPVEETFNGQDATGSSVSITGDIAYKEITADKPLTFYVIVKKNAKSIDFKYVISAFLEGSEPTYDSSNGEIIGYNNKNAGAFWYNITQLTEVEAAGSTYKDAETALAAYITANSDVTIDQNKRKSLLELSNNNIKGEFTGESDCHFYALTLGIQDAASGMTSYNNQRIGVRANIMATQSYEGEFNIHTVGDPQAFRNVLSQYQPGDTIQLMTSLDITGDVVFGAPLNLDLNGHTLTVTGNVRFEYGLNYETTIDTTGGGRLIVKSAGNAGGDLSIMCPDSQVNLNGTNSSDPTKGDIYVQGSFSVRAAYDEGIIFNGCNVYETTSEGGIPTKAEDVKYKTIYVYDSTWVQIANNTTVGDIRVADANVTFFRLLNNGTVNHVYADKVSILMEEQFLSPQIDIYNNGVINGTNNKHITLPYLSVKWEEETDADGKVITTGNTRIVQGFKSNPLAVEGSMKFFQEHIEHASVGDLVEMDGSPDKLIVNYRNAGNDGPTTLEGILNDFFSKNAASYPTGTYETIKQLTVRTGYGKHITVEDYACIRNFTNLEYIDLSAAETVKGDVDINVLPDENGETKTFSGHVYYIPAGAFQGLVNLKTILLPSDTQVIRYALMGDTTLTTTHPTIVLPDSVVAIEMDPSNANKHALHHFYIVDMPTISTTVQVYVGGTNAGGDEHRIIVPTNKLAEYRTAYDSPEEINHWIPTSQFDDNGNYLVHFNDGKYTVTAVLGNVTDVKFADLQLGGTGITVNGIFDYVFYNRKNITSANLDGIETIGASAFENAAVGHFANLGNVTSVGKRAFYDMTWSDAVAFELLANIGEEAFAYTTKTEIPSITLPRATVIGNKAFYNVQIGEGGSISIGATNITTSIGTSAFENLDAAGKTVTFNGAISTIGEKAFYGANTGALTFKGAIGTIGNKAFTKKTGTSLGAITFGGNIDLIKGGADKTGGLYYVEGTSLIFEGDIINAEDYAIYDVKLSGESDDPKLGTLYIKGNITLGNSNFYTVRCTTLTVDGTVDAKNSCFRDVTSKTVTFAKDIEADEYFLKSLNTDTLVFNGDQVDLGKFSLDNSNAAISITFNSDVSVAYDSLKSIDTVDCIFNGDVTIGIWAFRDSNITNLRFNATLNAIVNLGANATIVDFYVYRVEDLTADLAFNDEWRTAAKITRFKIDHVGKLGAGLVTLPGINDFTFESVDTIATSFNKRKEYGKITIKSNIGTIQSKAFQGVTVNGDLNFKNVTTIGKDAFSGAKIIGYVNFNGNVQTIGENAFGAKPMEGTENTNTATTLKGLTFKGDIYEVLSYAFYNLNITGDDNTDENKIELRFQGNVTAIGDHVFQGANAKNIIFEKSLNAIGNYAFANLKGGVTIQIMGNIAEIGDSVLEGTEAELVLFGVNEVTDGEGNKSYTMVADSYIDKIGKNAFNGSTIKNMYITKVGTIGTESFTGCNITGEVVFLGDVTKIEDSAFAGVVKIGTLHFMGNLGEAGTYVFAGGEGENERSAITNLIFEKNLGYIGQGVFTNCNIANVTFAGDIIEIGLYAFKNAIFGGDVIFEGNVGEIKGEAFYGIKAGDIVFEGEVGNLSDTSTTTMQGDPSTTTSLAFAYANVKKIHFEKGVEYIGKWAFTRLQAYEIVVGEQNAEIKDMLETTVANDAFTLVKITKDNVGNYSGGIAFYNHVDNANMAEVNDGHVPANWNFTIEGELYFKSIGTLSLSTHGNTGTASVGVLRIDDIDILRVTTGRTFTIREVYLPNTLKKITFKGISGIAVFEWKESTDNSLSVEMGHSENYDAFAGLTFVGNELVFPAQVKSLPDSACKNMSANKVTFNGVTSVGEWCFKNSNIGTIELPKVTALNATSTFHSAIGTHTIKMPLLTEITSTENFVACRELATLEVPMLANITVQGAFAGAENLKTLNLPGVEELGVEGIFGDIYEEDGTTIGHYESAMPEYEVKKYTYIENLSMPNLTNIAAKAFAGNTHLKTLTLDSFVTAIATVPGENDTVVTTRVDGVFQGMTVIETIRLPALTEITTGHMFDGLTTLKEIDLSGVTSISGTSTFNGCKNLSKINLSNLTSITGNFTFSGLTKIKEVTATDDAEITAGVLNLPALKTWSGHSTFVDCSGLLTLTLNITEFNSQGSAQVSGSGFKLQTVNFPELVIMDASSAFYNVKTLVTFNAPKLTTISGGNNFQGCSALVTLNVPELTTISGAGNFIEAGLKSVSMLNLTSLGASSFNRCTKLTSVSMPNLTSMGGGCFEGCSRLYNIYLPSVTSLPQNAFKYCGAIPYVGIDPTGGDNHIMPNLTSIGGSCFESGGAITSIDLPYLTTGSGTAFNMCSNLKTVNLPALKVGARAMFASCPKLESVRMDSLETGGELMFSRLGQNPFCTSLKTVYMPKLTTVSASMFAGCTALTELKFPKATSVGGSAFTGCTSLQVVELGAVTSLAASTFSAPTGNCVVIIRGNVDTNITGLDALTNKVVFIGNYGTVAEGSEIYGNLAELAAGWSTDNIGYYSDANGVLRYVYTTEGTPVFPGNIQLLYCFDDTIANADLTADFTAVETAVRGTVTSIGASCYFNTVIGGEGAVLNLGENVTYIGAHAFSKRTAEAARSTFKTFETGNVTEIGAYAFQNCRLTDLSLGVKLTKLGKTAFGTTENVRIAQQAATEFNLVLDEADTQTGSTMFGANAVLYVNGLVLENLKAKGDYFGAIPLTNNNTINTDSMVLDKYVDFYYVITSDTEANKTVKITGIVWKDTSQSTLVIPDTIKIGEGDGAVAYKVTQISERAFSGVKDIITELTLPKHLAAFDPKNKEESGLVFNKADALTNLTAYHVDEDCVNYSVDANGVLYNKVEGQATMLILCPINVAGLNNGVLTIPSTVTKFYVYAFYGNENVVDTNTTTNA